MKQNSSFTSFLLLVIAALPFTITSMLMTSCSGVKYTYYNKQKVPYTAPAEIKLAKPIPPKPFLNQEEGQLQSKLPAVQDKDGKEKEIAKDNNTKKEAAPSKLGQIFQPKNIAKFIPKQPGGIQSEKKTFEDRELMIVLLVVLILVVIALLGDELLWLLFLALLILLIYALVKYLGILN